jgi:hypothetical protein
MLFWEEVYLDSEVKGIRLGRGRNMWNGCKKDGMLGLGMICRERLRI